MLNRYTMKGRLFLFIAMLLTAQCFAQDTEKEAEEDRPRGFQKDRLFTGGSVTASFYTGGFVAGVNPMFGYSLAKWADAGIVVNYNYASQKGINTANDKIKQTNFGAGIFTRFYLFRFLFIQGQLEQNFITQRYDGANLYADETVRVDAPSTLVGGGYCSGRQEGNAFFYMSILYDIAGKEFSPYIDGSGRAVPVVRAGVQIPLFQGRKNRD